jgi:hypothetical protein
MPPAPRRPERRRQCPRSPSCFSLGLGRRTSLGALAPSTRRHGAQRPCSGLVAPKQNAGSNGYCPPAPGPSNS